MRKIAKTLTALLLAGTTLSLMCGCDNGAAKDKNSSVSGGSSATQSTASDKSDTSSKDESKTDETSSKDDSKPDEASDPDYEKMMSLANQIKPDFTEEQVVAIMGEPDYIPPFSSKTVMTYYFGKYCLNIQYDGYSDSSPDISIDDLSKPQNPYDKNAKYDSEFMEILNKVSSIKQNFTKEDVEKILGKPDKVPDKYTYDCYSYEYGDYSVLIRYIDDGLILDIYDSKLIKTVNVLYPS